MDRTHTAAVKIILALIQIMFDIVNTMIPASPCRTRQQPNAVSYRSANTDDTRPEIKRLISHLLEAFIFIS